MRRFVLTFYVIVFIQTLGFAIESHITDSQITDSVSIKYEICGNDTIYIKKYFSLGNTTFCGLKKYEDDLFLELNKKVNQIEDRYLIDKLNSDNANRTAFAEFIIRKILEGYGKERCTEMLKINISHSNKIQILINIDVEGRIFDLDFSFTPNCAEFMTSEDIIRNTNILINSEPFRYFTGYSKMGAKILPPIVIWILKNSIEDYLEEEATGE